jgi:hypothetical protein
MPSLIFPVNRAVTFDYKMSFMAIEVCDVVSELMLPPELETLQLTFSQKLPQKRFGSCLLRPQLAGNI